MKYWSFVLIAALIALGVSGCATHRSPTAAEGQAVFAALQQAVVAAGTNVQSSLVLVKVDSLGTDADRRSLGSMPLTRGSPDGSVSMSGVVLTPAGLVLVPSVIKPDQDRRITVFAGDIEYTARPLKADETLGMTVLKLDADESFTPLDLSHLSDLASGEWVTIVRATDEDLDYQPLSILGVCQGERIGPYRQYLINQPLGSAAGAVAVNLKGQVVGVVDRGTVLSLNDVREDLLRLLADAQGISSPDDEKRKKGWLGAVLTPINKDYAKLKGLSPSTLLVLHTVADGPADRAGVREGDLVVALNGEPLRLTGSRALDYFLKALHPRPGEKFSVTVLRDGKSLERDGTIAPAPEPSTLEAEDLGVTVSRITDSEYFLQNLATDLGVLVTDVQRGSPAANSGTLRQTLISRNDIIVELAGQPTPTIEDFARVLESIRRTHPPVVLVKYYRGVLTGYAGLNLTLGEKENGSRQ